MTFSKRFWNFIGKHTPIKSIEQESKMITRCKPFLEKHFNVLDIGCGPGSYSIELGMQTNDVFAIDPSEEMINSAKKARENFPESKVSFNVGFLEDTPARQQFNAICAFNVLHFIDDLPSFFNEVQLRLQPDGLFISSTACMGEGQAGLKLMFKGLSTIKLIPRMQFYTVDALANNISTEGFEILHQETYAKLPELFLVGKKNTIL